MRSLLRALGVKEHLGRTDTFLLCSCRRAACVLAAGCSSYRGRREGWLIVPEALAPRITGASQVALVVNNPPASAGDLRDVGLIPGSERSPGEGNGNPLQYSCLENPMDRGAWWATVHWIEKSQTQLKWPSTHTHTLNEANLDLPRHNYHRFQIMELLWELVFHFFMKLSFLVHLKLFCGDLVMLPFFV